MNYYEKILIIDPNIDDAAAEEVVDKIKDIIIKNGGEILKTDHWGRRKLAYELNKHQKGNYILLYFKSPPSTIAELEKLCKVVDSIIKFMVVKYEKKKQIEALMPSPADKSESSAETKSDQEKAVEEGENVSQTEEKKDVQ